MATAQQEQQREEVSVKELLEAGAHFGHQTQRWNPKMKRYIFGEKNGIYIIDLAKTLKLLKAARDIVKETVAARKSILFVGTKKAAKALVRECAETAGEFYVAERWLGGMMTNLSTLRQSVKKLERIEKRIAAGGEGATKKEISIMTKDQVKLEKNLSGVRAMRKPPGLIIVVDPTKEYIAVQEATKLGIPIMAICDTNCNPDPITHVIPANDDAQRSIKLILESLTQTIVDKKNELNFFNEKADDEEEGSEDASRSSDISPEMRQKIEDRVER